jgi:general secretion pathway protein G
MDSLILIIFCIILFLLLYLCVFCRKKGPRTLGWALYALFIIFALLSSGRSGGGGDGARHSRIISDLRTLKSAALLYYADTGRWLVAGEEASLDRYPDSPIVNANPKRYAAVTIGPKFICNGEEMVNIGVTLIPGQDDNAKILKKLASRAESLKLLAGPTVTTEYDGKGLDVWMRMR